MGTIRGAPRRRGSCRCRGRRSPRRAGLIKKVLEHALHRLTCGDLVRDAVTRELLIDARRGQTEIGIAATRMTEREELY